MRNNGKNCLPVQNLALRLHISEEELAIKAGDQFFPQRTNYTDEDDVPMAGAMSPMDSYMDPPFTMGELLSAL